jgi:Transposase IS116/IS110/IS902 family
MPAGGARWPAARGPQASSLDSARPVKSPGPCQGAGLGWESAMALIAEIGLDMSRFPTPEALVSWAGLTPTARQSGPRSGRGKKGHGHSYAKRIGYDVVITLREDAA